MGLPLETPNARRLLNFVQEVSLALGETPGMLKLSIDDPGDDGRREHCRDYLLSPEVRADKVTLDVLHEAQEQADGSGEGPHRFRVHAYMDQAPKPFRATALTVESTVVNEETSASRKGSASSLLDQAYRRIDGDHRFIMGTLGTTLHALTEIVSSLGAQVSGHHENMLQNARLSHDIARGRAELEVDVETRKALLAGGQKLIEIFGPVLGARMAKKLAMEDAEEEAKREEPKSEIPAPSVVTPVIPAVATAVIDQPKNGHAKSRRKRT